MVITGLDERLNVMTNIDDSKLRDNFRGAVQTSNWPPFIERNRGPLLKVAVGGTAVLCAAYLLGATAFLGPDWDGKTNFLYGGGELLERKDFGEDWPYAESDEAFLRCIMVEFGANTNPRPVVTVEVNGKIYGVNGVAKGRLGLRDGRELLARGEYDEPVYKASHAFIERAISNCTDSRHVMSSE